MQKSIVFLAVLSTVLLTACGSKTDASEKNFGAAIAHYLDKKGNLCVTTGAFPVDLSETSRRGWFGEDLIAQMSSLEAAGLVKKEDIEEDVLNYQNKPTGAKKKIMRYTLTDKAKPFTEGDGDKFHRLCWGKKALSKIVKWEGPMKFGDYQEAKITYTYKVNNLADWAKKPDVQAAFPAVKKTLDEADKTEQKHQVKLTSQGWEALGLD